MLTVFDAHPIELTGGSVIWLPLHGYGFEQTPLWAGIYMVPLTVGFILAGPVSGWLSDHYGSRPFATGGMLLAALSFGLLLLPANFSYPAFAGILFLNGAAFGRFASPNTASVMNSVPARNRGAASGMLVTFQNTGFPLSIGIFFSLMIRCRSCRRSATCSPRSSDTTR
jgi:MFS family permease